MGNTTDSLFSVFHVFPPPPPPQLPFITKLPSPPPCPQATGAVSTKLRLGMWPPDENQLAQRDACLERTMPISVSIIMGPIYSENRLIVWLLVPCYPQYAPAEWSFAMRTCHWMKTIKLQRGSITTPALWWGNNNSTNTNPHGFLGVKHFGGKHC